MFLLLEYYGRRRFAQLLPRLFGIALLGFIPARAEFREESRWEPEIRVESVLCALFEANRTTSSYCVREGIGES